MRKVVLGVAVSLDSFIEGPNGEYDWCFTDQDYGMAEFLQGVDAIFYGRKSYELMANFEGGNPFNSKKEYVFSTTMKEGPGFTVVRNLSQAREIINGQGKDIWLFGGASLTSAMLKAALVDELWLAVHPVILGAGKPLFENITERMNLRLLSSKTYNTGLVSVKYSLKQKDS
jgi:dihydrofolate reductase